MEEAARGHLHLRGDDAKRRRRAHRGPAPGRAHRAARAGDPAAAARPPPTPVESERRRPPIPRTSARRHCMSSQRYTDTVPTTGDDHGGLTRASRLVASRRTIRASPCRRRSPPSRQDRAGGRRGSTRAAAHLRVLSAVEPGASGVVPWPHRHDRAGVCHEGGGPDVDRRPRAPACRYPRWSRPSARSSAASAGSRVASSRRHGWPARWRSARSCSASSSFRCAAASPRRSRSPARNGRH